MIASRWSAIPTPCALMVAASGRSPSRLASSAELATRDFTVETFEPSRVGIVDLTWYGLILVHPDRDPMRRIVAESHVCHAKRLV
jgi:hypothetical protein